MEHGKKVLAGGRSTGRMSVRCDHVDGPVTAVFAFQQRADKRTICGGRRSRRPSRGCDVRVRRTAAILAMTVMVLLLWLMVVMLLLLLELMLMMVIAVRVVRELQARVASVERVLHRPLLLARGRQTSVGAGAQHVAAVVVHRLRRMLTGRTSAAVAGTAGAAVSRASFYAYHHNPLRQTNANTTH